MITYNILEMSRSSLEQGNLTVEVRESSQEKKECQLSLKCLSTQNNRIEGRGIAYVKIQRLRRLHIMKFVSLGGHDAEKSQKDMQDQLCAGRTVSLRTNYYHPRVLTEGVTYIHYALGWSPERPSQVSPIPSFSAPLPSPWPLTLPPRIWVPSSCYSIWPSLGHHVPLRSETAASWEDNSGSQHSSE